MTRVNGHGPHKHPGPGVPDEVFAPFGLSVIVLGEQLEAFMAATDWPTRRLVAAQIDAHLNCVAMDLGAVRRWLALYSPDLRRSDGGRAATGPGDAT